MLGDLTYIKSFHQRDDIHQPNFIFSSDISDKINILVSRYLDYDSSPQDIGNEIQFNINIELNTLISRNQSLKPSDLIKENLICIANDSDGISNKSKNIISPKNKSIPQLFKFISGGVFIVNLKLELLEFVPEKVTNRISVGFLKDENYEILALCEEELIDQIRTYIKKKFILELNRHSDNVFIDSESEDNKKSNEISNITNNISTNDNTLEDSDYIAEKSFIYEDEDEYESSFDDLMLLKSNDTLGSPNDDEHDFINDNIVQIRSKSMTYLNPISQDNNNVFLKEMDNLRHNEELLENEDISKAGTSCATDEHLKDLNFFGSPKSDKAFLLPKLNTNDSTPMTRQSSIASFSSPTRKILSAKPSISSFSMINNGENPDLEYAFRDTSALVPNFIKDDKKFKFIKVGKVQKFVNLFEEKMTDNSTSNSGASRPSTPVRKLH